MKRAIHRFLPLAAGTGTPWGQRETDLPLPARLRLRLLKIVLITIRSPFNRQLLSHASALSFTSLLSLVPLLAMIFSIAKGFGLQDRIEPWLLEKAVGGHIAADLIPKITEYVANTKVMALGSIGLVFMVYMAFSMLGQIESSFNRIWGIKKTRSLLRKASDYLSLLIIGPLFLGVSLGLSTTLSSSAVTHRLLDIGLFAGAMKLLLLALPWLTNTIILTLLYLIIPNTQVRFAPALQAGMATGCLWQVTQIIFIDFQIGVARYNAIYGTFASVPIFMLWLLATWILVLLGGVVSFACQHAETFHPLQFEKEVSYAFREKISLAVLLVICQAFERGEGASTVKMISKRLGVAESLVSLSLPILLAQGAILQLRNGKNDQYVPAKPAKDLRVSHFFKQIAGPEAEDLQFRDQEINAAVTEILSRRQQALETTFVATGLNMGA